MKHLNLFILLLVFLMPPLLNAQNYDFTEIPSWVKAIDIPKESEISKYDIASGYYLTMGDYQFNLETNTIFNRDVFNVISYNGITNASQISVAFDTSYQKLHIHHLLIWRNGKRLDRTEDLSLEILNTEQLLNQGIYTGQITAYDILNDIRKDDLIDFAYSIEGENPIFNNEKYLFLPLESFNPIDLYYVRLIYAKDKDYSYECVDCDSLLFSENEMEEYHEVEIINKNLEALDLEESIPSWDIPYKYFVISSLNSWADVNKWAQEVFHLEKEPNLEEVYQEIFTGEEDTNSKINKIINYVQDDIRYMGIESGIGNIKPFPPETVVKQRFGDCKDKSLLMVYLLKQIGVEEAYPVLVNTNWKHKTDRHFPSNGVFNHCIVTFNYNDTTYWIDPTIAVQGGDFKELYTPNYGKVLIIGQAKDSLDVMVPKQVESTYSSTEEIFITSFTQPATLQMNSFRTGFEADGKRAMFEYFSLKDFSEWVTDDLKKTFPKVTEKSDMKIEDDMIKNTIKVSYNYEIDGFWQDGDQNSNSAAHGLWIYKFEPQNLYQYFKKSTCEERKFDFELIEPVDYSYHYILHFHKDIMIYDEFKTVDTEAFYFEESIEQIDKKSFRIDYKLQLKVNSLNTEEYKEFCEKMSEISEDLPLIIYFQK